MKKLLLILIILTITTPAYADYLGCFEPNEAVEVKTLYLNSSGVLTDPTSPACDILDPNDTTLTSCTSGPTKVGSLTGIYESSHTIPASPLEGVWIVKQKGTVDSSVRDAADYFMVVDVAGECPGRAGVKISDGTGAGQIDTLNGAIVNVDLCDAATSVTNPVTLPTIPTDWITATGIAAGAITVSEAPNMDAAISTRSTFNAATEVVDLDFTLACPVTPTAGTVGDACKTSADSTAQTGDSFARLGVPAGASVSADIAGVKAETALIIDDTGTSGVVLAADAITPAKVSDLMENRMGWKATIDLTGNTGTFILSCNSECISVADQFKGDIITCGNETREIVRTASGTPDTITTEPFRPFPSAPTSTTCVVRNK